jgi:hypothetical protein
MDSYNSFDQSIDDFAYSFSDEIPIGAGRKLQAALSEKAGGLRAFAANVLIGHIPSQRVNECVGEEFKLCGFHVKSVTFKDSGREGKYVVLFGYAKGKPCAYSAASDKLYEAIKCILYVYGDVSNWGDGINARIRMNTGDDVKAYSLEVL